MGDLCRCGHLAIQHGDDRCQSKGCGCRSDPHPAPVPGEADGGYRRVVGAAPPRNENGHRLIGGRDILTGAKHWVCLCGAQPGDHGPWAERCEFGSAPTATGEVKT